MKLGKITNLILFGGGQDLVNLISTAKGYDITVISAPRLLNENIKREGTSLIQYLRKNKIKFFNSEDISSFKIYRFINNGTLGISFGAPWLFTGKFIRKFNKKLINCHCTNLPKNRGCGGYSWQIMNGAVSGCYLFHFVSEGIDTGDIVFFKKFKFPKNCRTPESYKDYFYKKQSRFFRDFILRIDNNHNFDTKRQDENLSTYFPRLSTMHHGFIDWEWRSSDIESFISAFDLPFKGASTFLDGKRVFLKKAKKITRDGKFHPFMRGLIYRKINNTIFIATPDAAISIKDVFCADEKDIFKKIKVGQRFVTPQSILEKALEFKAVYDAKGLKIKKGGI